MKWTMPGSSWCIVLAMLTGVFIIPALASSEIIYVGPGEVFTTIQAGIDAARTGDRVIVSDGTFRGAGNKNLDFKGKAITVKSEYGPKNCVIDCERDGRGFYFHTGEGRDSVLSGFTIKNGLISDSSNDGGGAIYCKLASPTIANCIISGNSAGTGGGICLQYCTALITGCRIIGNTSRYNGGGIYANNGSDDGITMRRCTISGNSALNGGGVYVWYTPTTIVKSTIAGNSTTHGNGGGIYFQGSTNSLTDSTIVGNSSKPFGFGGGIFYQSSNTTMAGCTIERNSSYTSGGIYLYYYSTAMLTDCEIRSNSASWEAGGVGCHWHSTASLDSCNVVGNSADAAGGVGCSEYSSATIVNCGISGNWGNFAGGIGCDDHCSLEVANSTIIGNKAGVGGGVYCYDNSSAVITNCTITGTSNGSSLRLEEHSSGTVVNCILWDNQYEQIRVIDSTVAVKYSDIQGGYPGAGNIDRNPLFVASSMQICHLQPESPCIGAGTNDAPSVPPTDKDGHPRIVNGVADMGAYEYCPTCLPVLAVGASDRKASEVGPDVGKIRIYRVNGDESLRVTASYIMLGTATNGEDYQMLSGKVTIPSTRSNAKVTVTPIEDTLDEGVERVILRLMEGNGYKLSMPDRASVRILDN